MVSTGSEPSACRAHWGERWLIVGTTGAAEATADVAVQAVAASRHASSERPQPLFTAQS
jgi:hypothetical protein